jgi:putative IMPACT (imprinted ancient) family translation regulator
VLIGVVRYYGGTKLGVGGLIHAYRTGALEAIQAGKIVEKEISSSITLRFSMVEMPFIMNAVKSL